MSIVLILAGSLLIVIWGTAHLFPTKNVVKGFGDISRDNKRIITMEWIFEGVTLIFMGLLIILVTLLGNISDNINRIVYWSSAGMLIVIAAISSQTGGKVNFLFYKLCAPIFTASALLLLLGTLV
jgi:hypothetical protein